MGRKKGKRKDFRIAWVVAGLVLVSVTGYGEPTNYTYNYDWWGDPVQSPDAYRVTAYLTGASLGIGVFRTPQGLFVKDNLVYICDSGNNRIVVIEVKDEVKENNVYEVKNIFTSFLINEKESALNYPTDLFVTGEGDIYIADMNNQRILRLDSEWNYKSAVLKPVDQTFDPAADFLPNKLVVDFAGRIFVKAVNINKGFLEFDDGGNFVGYMGAINVVVDPIDYIWKRIATRAQRARMDLFVPTEYSNVCLDHEGFLYAVNDVTAVDTYAGSGRPEFLQPVRRLNSMGQDILIRNGSIDPFGDNQWSVNSSGINGPSRFIDVAAFDNDSYACFDQTRGRIFVYDFQGNLLYAFGGVGNREGYFLLPSAIAAMGYSLFALDARTAALTRFEFTGYGKLINDALVQYRSGRYEDSAAAWEQVLKVNGNYELAYIGIGRAALRQGDYKKAMEYYKLKYYDTGYGKAFQKYRKQWVEKNLWKILLILGIVIIMPSLVKRVSKFVKEIREA
jgi:tetratricopeptide (TPR) repeat protein